MDWFNLLKTSGVSVEKILTMKPPLETVMDNIEMYADRATKNIKSEDFLEILRDAHGRLY
tara:strand:+ start:85 stop:264 length:180 start_codon:yes stop_codon:yes gene_type:complete